MGELPSRIPALTKKEVCGSSVSSVLHLFGGSRNDSAASSDANVQSCHERVDCATRASE